MGSGTGDVVLPRARRGDGMFHTRGAVALGVSTGLVTPKIEWVGMGVSEKQIVRDVSISAPRNRTGGDGAHLQLSGAIAAPRSRGVGVAASRNRMGRRWRIIQTPDRPKYPR